MRSGNRDAASAAAADRIWAGGLIRNKTHIVRRRSLDHYAVVYLLSGGGWFTADNVGERCVGTGDALLLFPGQEHGYGPQVPRGWAETWLLFDGPMIRQLEERGVISRATPLLHAGVDPAIAETMAALVADVDRGVEADQPWLAARMLALLTDLVRRHRLAHQRRRGVAFIPEACALLASEPARPIDLERLARRYHLSLERFRKVFANEVGMPPARFRLRKRLEHARALLIDSGLSLAAVASAVGFCDAYQFNRQFRRHLGLSPGRFRCRPGEPGR